MDDLEDDPGIRAGVAANLSRLYAADQREFLETLAKMLEVALPGQVRVERRGGLFSEKRVGALDIQLGEHTYVLESLAAGMLVATRCKIVRGIKLKTEILPIEEWLLALTSELEEHAWTHQQARDALKRFIGS